jgi:ribosome recycling factor
MYHTMKLIAVFLPLVSLTAAFLPSRAPFVGFHHHLPQQQQQQQQRYLSSTPLFAAAEPTQGSSSGATTSVKDVTSDAQDRMTKSVDSVRINLQSVRTGRASPQMLDRIKVEYYGVETPLNQMASIGAPSAQQLSIDPYDKSTLGSIETAIMEADLGLTPNNDGSVIRINVPSMTEDRRKDMLKLCKSIGEEGKVAIRNIRRDGVDAVKKLEKGGAIGRS